MSYKCDLCCDTGACPCSVCMEMIMDGPSATCPACSARAAHGEYDTVTGWMVRRKTSLGKVSWALHNGYFRFAEVDQMSEGTLFYTLVGAEDAASEYRDRFGSGWLTIPVFQYRKVVSK